MACGSCWTRPRRCRWRCSPPCCSAGARCPSACSGWSATCAMAAVAEARRRHERPGPMSGTERPEDRKSVGEGKGGSVRVDLGGRSIIKKKNKKQTEEERND